MTFVEDEQELGVPQQAVRALTEAHRRAVEAGHPVVLVQDGQLVRRVGNQVIVLKPMRGRRKVAVLIKRRGS